MKLNTLADAFARSTPQQHRAMVNIACRNMRREGMPFLKAIAMQEPPRDFVVWLAGALGHPCKLPLGQQGHSR